MCQILRFEDPTKTGELLRDGFYDYPLDWFSGSHTHTRAHPHTVTHTHTHPFTQTHTCTHNITPRLPVLLVII